MTKSEFQTACDLLMRRRDNPLATAAHTGNLSKPIQLSQGELDSILEWRDLGNGKAVRRVDAPISGTWQGVAASAGGAAMEAIDAYRDCMVTGAGSFSAQFGQIDGAAIRSMGNDAWRIHESPEAIRAAATEAERARIMAILETCRPTDQPYTRRDWAIEEKGKRDLFAKIMKALGEPVKEGEE